MKKKQAIIPSLGLALGLLMIYLTFFVFPERAGTAGNSVLIGLGIGLVGSCSTWLFLCLLYHCSTAEQRRQWERMERDERARTMREKSGLAAWYVTLLCTSALAFLLLSMHNYPATALVLALFGIENVSYFGALYFNSKRM